MCTLIIERRPGHDWPILLAANRDEMTERACKPPARHWPDRPDVVAGIDLLAGGSWLGVNKYGVVAGVLNRRGALGPGPGLRSRGELPLEALDHANATAAAQALAQIEPSSYRSFNLVVADSTHGFCLSCEDGRMSCRSLPPGLSMVTAHDLNDLSSPRIKMYLPRFRAAKTPDPESADWSSWQSLLASRIHDAQAGPEGAMNVDTGKGLATVSSSLIALPGINRENVGPIWLHAAGNPAKVPFESIEF